MAPRSFHAVIRVFNPLAARTWGVNRVLKKNPALPMSEGSSSSWCSSTQVDKKMVEKHDHKIVMVPRPQFGSGTKATVSMARMV